MEHGNACVGELVKYKFEALGMQVQCKNKAGTCERSLCECDNLLGNGLSIISVLNPSLGRIYLSYVIQFDNQDISTDTCIGSGCMG